MRNLWALQTALICTALVISAGMGWADATTWYQLSLEHASVAGAPHRAVSRAGTTVSVAYLVPGGDGQALVVCQAEASHQVVYVLSCEARTIAPLMHSGSWAEEPVQAATAACGALYLGTRHGILRVEGTDVKRFAEFAEAGYMHIYASSPLSYFYSNVTSMVADGGGDVWLTADGTRSHSMFCADRALWMDEYGGKPLETAYPVIRRWRVPVQQMAGDPRRRGLWTYGRRPDGMGDIFYADACIRGNARWECPSSRSASVAYPVPETYGPRKMRHTRSALPVGVVAPQLAEPLMAADIAGRCWLADGAEGGASIHVFDGQGFTDVTPPPELLKGSQLRQLVCDNARGELLVATSAAGVLVFDGAQWSEHPLNSLLPTIEDTEMKPVDRIAVADDGGVWVATASYLLHWTRDDEQQ